MRQTGRHTPVCLPHSFLHASPLMETTNTAVLLQVVICTHGLDGLMRTAAMTLPQLPRISWLVECQTDADAPLPDVPEALRAKAAAQFKANAPVCVKQSRTRCPRASLAAALRLYF